MHGILPPCNLWKHKGGKMIKLTLREILVKKISYPVDLFTFLRLEERKKNGFNNRQFDSAEKGD
jgi:hypothetical protein